jgi:RNA polymerase sigma-70 factor (ECF subfamily)
VHPNHVSPGPAPRPPGWGAVADLWDRAPGPEASLQASQRDQGLQLALAGLSAEQRQIIVLRDYMDLSYSEIADVLEIAQGTVMSKLHRARMALREELGRHG